MNDPMPVPMAQPVEKAPPGCWVSPKPGDQIVRVGVAEMVAPFAEPLQSTPPAPVLARPPTDLLAVASAVCGLTAIVPFVSQILGLGFGIAGLVRIRRARRQGVVVGGAGWALTGILTSGFALLGWAATIIALLLVGASFASTAESLQAVVDTVR